MMVYVIAEIGCNHNGDVELAKKMVDAAVDSGVNAVKFQTFKADKLISKIAPKAAYQVATTGDKDSQLEMTKRLELSYDDYLVMKAYCESKSVDVFSTAFDMDSLHFLESTDMSIYKISSGEITNLPFLEEIGSLNKKVLLSTGMATMGEIHKAIDILEENGTHDITILHCTTEYPTPDGDLNLNVIKNFQKEFQGYQIGFSDHSIGHMAGVMAATMGVSVIEKHFTTDNNLPGPDQKASGTPDVFKALVEGIKFVQLAKGSYDKVVTPIEMQNRIVARKSIIAKRPIKKGEIFSEENITMKRPGNGISPMHWHEIMGMKSESDFNEDELVTDARFETQG